MITLEYSRVKATTVSVRLRIYSQLLKYPTPPLPAEPTKSADSMLGTVSATLQLPAELPEHSY